MAWLKIKEKMMVTQDRLKELLEYDCGSGNLFWRESRKRIVAGAVAGAVLKDGYVCIRLDGVRYIAQKLIWLYTTGAFPTKEIDHINRDRADNRLVNLREVTHAENMQNRSYTCRSISKMKGVTLYARTGKWRAQICVNGNAKHLGYFRSKEDASAAYTKAADLFFTHHKGESSAIT
jgi:hypothetical protein